MGDDFTVRVEGLTELRRNLRQLGDKGLTTDLRDAHKGAAEVVASQARSLAPSRTGRLRASIRAGGTQTKGYVAGGKKSVPYFGWIDFGGRIRQPTRNRTLYRPYMPKGRILYKALSMRYDQARGIYDRKVGDLVRKAGLDR